MDNNLVFPKGTIIVCPDCNKEIQSFAKDAMQGASIVSDLFEPLNDEPQIKNGDMAVHCTSMWMRVYPLPVAFNIKDHGFVNTLNKQPIIR